MSDMRTMYTMLTYYQSDAMRQACPNKTPSAANAASIHSSDDNPLVNQHTPRWLALQPTADIESGRADQWVLVRASYIRAVWWAYAALLMVIVLYWIVVKCYQSILAIGYGPL